MTTGDWSRRHLMKNHLRFASRSVSRLLGMALMILLLTASLITPQSAGAQAHRYRIKLYNHSRYDIHRIYMSSAESNRWGHDLLGDSVLASSNSFTIIEIVPGEWDIKFVDEDGDACILRNVKVFDNLSWSITTDWLVHCQDSGRCHCHDDGR